MHKKDLRKKIGVTLLAFCMGITTYIHPFAFAEDGMDTVQDDNTASAMVQNETDVPEEAEMQQEGNDPSIIETDEAARTEPSDLDVTETSNEEAEEDSDAEKNNTEETEARLQTIEEPVTEDVAFNASKSDYIGYDPLYIAKYADPRYVNADEIDMACFYNLPAAAKGIATYNVKKQSDFDVTEKNFIAGLTYEMPVYNIDNKSKYYVCIPNVNLFNDSFKAYDLTVAYNNDYAELIKGWKYSKGILYIPKNAIDDPKNEKPVPENTILAVQLNYAIGGDMDFSKAIPVQVLKNDEPTNKTVKASNLFDRDSLTVSTGVKGRKTSDISVYLNGNLIPINESAWHYDDSNGNIDIQVAPGVVSNINIIFQQRNLREKVRDISTSAVESITTAAYAAVSMEDMSFFKTDDGAPIELDIRSKDIFVGWRGYFSGKYIHGNTEAKQAKRNNSPGYMNSVKYLYGGYTDDGGATDSSNKLAAAWAISSYATSYNMDNASGQGTLDRNTMVTHLNTLNGNVEQKTIYQWMLTYRNQLERSKIEYGAGHSNGIGGTNNFAFTLPKVVKGAETELVSAGENAGRKNNTIRFLSDQITAEQGSHSTSVYYDYWIAAGCNHLDMAEDDDLDAKDNDIYVTCIGLGNDYAVLAFVQSNGGGFTQNACGIYKFKLASSAYIKVKKSAASTDTNYMTAVPSNYTLAGAEYQLYTDAACSKAAKNVNDANAKLTTDAKGNTSMLEMEPGTYYVKEVKASKGFRIENADNGSPKVTKLVLTNKHTEDDPMVFISKETPGYNEPKFLIKKYDKTGTKGWDRLINAEYTISYYNIKVPYGDENVGQDPATVNFPDAPTRSWTFKTHKITAADDPSESYAGINWQTDEPVSGDPFYIENGKRILPIGYYTIRETKAPVGLSLNETIHYGKIYQKSNGKIASIYIDGKEINESADTLLKVLADEEPQKLTLAINKVDSETGKAEAQGADREYCNGSLAGAVYEVYFDNDEAPEPELVGLMTTNEKGEAVLAERNKGREETLGRALEAGTYYIKEIQASPGYVIDKFILDGKNTKEIKKGEIEVICGYDANGNKQTKKIKGSFEDGKHLFKARVQNKDTAVFGFTVTSKETPHHTIIHKTDIATGKELPGATLQVLDSRGDIIEEWVSTKEPHDIVALHDKTQGLKDGKYTLREITAPYGYDIAEDLEFSVEENVIATHVEMKNKPLEISTTAIDEMTGTHHGLFNEEERIKDLVEIKGLYEGRSYKVAGRVIDKSTGLPILDKDGNEITAESEEFISNGNTLHEELHFTIDSSEYNQDSSVVVFEKLYRTSSVHGDEVPIEIAKHEDIDDDDQSIHYGGIAKTIATDKKDGDHDLVARKKAVLVDTVEYNNLSTKETYLIQGVLYDKTTRELTDITGSAEFVPDSANGTIPVNFKFDAADLDGHSLVVFEYVYNKGVLISKHDDEDNEDQTVHFTAVRITPKTGDINYLTLYAITTVIAMFALSLMLYLRKIKM